MKAVSDFQRHEKNVKLNGGRELILYVYKQPNVHVSITMPGDVIVLRPGDHHAVMTVYLKGSSERLAMAAGLVFYRRCDMNMALR